MTSLAPQRISFSAGHPKIPVINPSRTNYLSLFGIDPGGVTGWSHIRFKKIVNGVDWWLNPLTEILKTAEWKHGQIDCIELNLGAYNLRKLLDSDIHAAVVFESFFIRQMAVDLSPIMLIAIAEHHLWMRGRVMHKQQAAMAKALHNDRLKELGVYTSDGGQGHARDADRHVLMMMRRCMDRNGKEKRKELWPNVYA